ncbi:unnamed protein product [Mytilus coruscus]|uniref:Required for excision 1-B domain-containing protein n=1 Tax=Mytilus coruscus TaxID=42192 RepID=A0A6J8CQY4_MYTCO|nr:unnamed protein product [Mytilus coruscus]CAC5398938.1 unnamed protein product [Mytilus coruscus]
MTDSVSVTDNSFETTAVKLLQRFHLLQQERVETYTLFEEGFVAYLKGHPNYNFPLYRQLVHEITETFNKISTDIIVIKTRLNDDHQQNTVAGLVSKIQDQEQKKLETTVQHQISRQNELDHPDVPEHKEQSESHKEKLKEVVDKINDFLEELKYESEELYAEEEDESHVER